ncbi:MAG: hypothetical protein DMG57_03630 [Acidobacteria bacterium]|nr:MAG: hypothetical protein DMG57_03630 [Acidobacteriota bacterium]
MHGQYIVREFILGILVVERDLDCRTPGVSRTVSTRRERSTLAPFSFVKSFSARQMGGKMRGNV